MIAKSLFAAAALAAGLAAALPVPAANADVGVTIGIGAAPGYYGYGNGYGGGYYGGYNRYHHDGYYGGNGYPRGYGYGYGYQPRPYYQQDEIGYISCGEGRDIVRRFGYRNVHTENCRAPNYVYTASRHGDRFEVRINVNGEINRVRRID